LRTATRIAVQFERISASVDDSTLSDGISPVLGSRRNNLRRELRTSRVFYGVTFCSIAKARICAAWRVTTACFAEALYADRTIWNRTPLL
jgi:hypothetical protein